MEHLQQEDRDDVYQARSHNTAFSPSIQHHNMQHRHSSHHHATSNMADTFSIDSSHYNDEQCGWSQCKPNKIQSLNSPKWFLFFLAVFSVSQSMIINGFTNVGLGTLEKQFKLSSKQSGMIVAAKELSSLLLIAFLSFYGSFGHKPKYLGYGAIMTACGSMLYVLPHALVGKHIPKGMSMKVFRNQELCSIPAMNQTVSEARCEMLGNSEWYYIFVFIIAKLLIGAGTAPLFTLGTSYLDENVKPKVAPVYLGIWYACTSFGPGIGFVAGGTLLNVYVDLIQPPGFDLTPEDPRWIGAWWLGHFFGAILIFMSACALLAYPRSMPGAREMRRQAIREGTLRPEDSRIQGKITDIVPATLTLFKNMTFMFNTLALTATMVISTGLGPFVVKYLQAQFGVSTMKAGIASGIALIPGTTIGIFLGSYLMRRMKGQDTCEGAARYCFIFQVLAVFSVSCFLITGCDRPSIVGIHNPYMNSTLSNNVTSACNLNCACNGIQFEPVCGVDNQTYYSPCHMGCSQKQNKTYASCRCLDHRFSEWNTGRSPVNYSFSLAFQERGLAAKLGECDRNCHNMVPFLCAIVVLLILNFVNAVPGKMVVMRCVPDNERAYALGVQWIVLTLLGAIPGPVLFGIFIDKTCDLWETTCHGQGNCLVYNNKKLSYRLAAAIFVFEALAAICYFISWKCYKPETEKETDKKLNSIYQYGSNDDPSSPTDDDDVDIRFTGSGCCVGAGTFGEGGTSESPDLTITTELSASCLSINVGISKSLLEVEDFNKESDGRDDS